MRQFKKVAIIGLDCALTHLIDRHIAEGALPNFRKLFEGGTVCDNALVPYPTITPPNWATICTGAWPGTHGVTDFWVHLPGTVPTNENAVCAFNTKWCQAETLWEAAERAGKKSIVFNYPGSWPSRMKNGIVVGGRGLAIGLVYDGHRHLEKDIVLAGDMLFTTDVLYDTVRVAFREAQGWIGLDEPGDDPLEAEVVPNFPHSASSFAPVTWHILVRDTGKGYDTVTLSPTKDMKDAFFTVKSGEWSPKVFTFIEADGGRHEVFFNAKVVRLSDDAEDFALYLNPLVKVRGWASDPAVDEEIRDVPGVPGNSGGYGAYTFGWVDADTWVEINRQHAEYNAAVALRLLKNHEWDIFAMHHHPPDWTYHLFMSELDPGTASSPQAHELAWRLHREMYMAADAMIGEIMAGLGDDVCIVLVSDHGATMDGPTVDPGDILAKAGLMTFKDEGEVDLRGETKTSAMVKKMFSVPDLSRSKAIPQRVCYIYVNLKGRYPDGVVEPEDYEKVQQEIIDALYAYKHPETGERCVSLALSREDARLLGLHGDGIGDVVYAVKPQYASQHGNILPTATWGIGSLHALLAFHGPGVKAGQRLDRPCNIVDLVPTLCYGGDLPIPRQCEGSVIYQIFDDPDFRLR